MLLIRLCMKDDNIYVLCKFSCKKKKRGKTTTTTTKQFHWVLKDLFSSSCHHSLEQISSWLPWCGSRCQDRHTANWNACKYHTILHSSLVCACISLLIACKKHLQCSTYRLYTAGHHVLHQKAQQHWRSVPYSSMKKSLTLKWKNK